MIVADFRDIKDTMVSCTIDSVYDVVYERIKQYLWKRILKNIQIKMELFIMGMLQIFYLATNIQKICLKEFAFSWLLCPVVLLHDWYLCGCWRYRNDDCTELWKMTIRLPLGFSLKSVGSFYVVPSEQIRPSVLTDTNVFFIIYYLSSG